MKFSTALFASASTTLVSTALAEEPFQQWWYRTAEAVALFPNVTGWEAAFDDLISPDVKVTFNARELDFEGLKAYWRTIPPIIERDYDFLVLTMNDAVGLPAEEGRGGSAFMTGTEVGRYKGENRTMTARQALFAIFNDDRKAIEWHEVVNTLQ
ncbi:hypothetical protein S40293_10731 [Stachybotrys chartarum IBT 40293]|nr:hypothetical protein S40293_10731 [Stachybotrys chartarum IBT 40293]